jgi:outer membrane protein OmpA-like peptidoglycan-associated protein
MMKASLLRAITVRIVPVVTLALLSTALEAQSVKIEGLIVARDGDSMILKTSESPNLVVLLTESTEVGQVQGVFQGRRKQLPVTALIPGLAVKVEGGYNEQNQLVAKSVSFKGNDLKSAQAIQAGLHETNEQTRKNEAELEKQNAELQAQNEELEKHQAELNEHQAKLVEHKAAIEAAVARFGELDDYYIFDETTVRFGNAKTKLDPTYGPQLLALAQKAKTINGYMIEVKGYASSTGNAGKNQQLSEERANNVSNFLIQQGHIPLTRMLVPGAMGESEQIGNEETPEGQAENRRVVVRVLQNKAIAGNLDKDQIGVR